MMDSGKRILIADDEPEIVTILSMRLRACGYQVSAAYNGGQAIERARLEHPDLLVLDAKMPDRDGYAVFEELRSSPDTRTIPIVFYSALPPEKAQERADQLGADAFVSKSADPRQIVTTIEEVLGRTQ